MSPSGVILTGLFFYRIRRGVILSFAGTLSLVRSAGVHKVLGRITMLPANLSTRGAQGPVKDMVTPRLTYIKLRPQNHFRRTFIIYRRKPFTCVGNCKISEPSLSPGESSGDGVFCVGFAFVCE